MNRILVNADGTIDRVEPDHAMLPTETVIQTDPPKVWKRLGLAVNEAFESTRIYGEVAWSSVCSKTPAEVAAGRSVSELSK